MNLFQEAKTILSKDGKVNPLGPYGKMKLMGKEVSTYFRRNPVKDAEIKKAVEVALDMSGAMTQAAQEIKRFYGDKILKSKEVQQALRYSNESTTLDGESLDEDYQKVIKMFPRDKDWKKLITKHKKAINDFRKNNKDLPPKVEDELVGWASQTGEVSHKDDAEDFIMSILDEKFKSYTIKGSERITDFEIQFRGDEKQSEKDWNQAKKIVSAYSKTHKLNIKDANGAPLYSDPREGSSAFKVGVFAKNNTNDKNHDLRPLVDQLAKLKTAEDHGGGYAKPIKEETISEAKNLMPEVQKIVDTKGAAKVGGVMLDMFTASVLTQAYAKVSDANKKKMESSNIQTLVKLAQRVMGMKEGVMDAEPLKGKYPFQKKFSVEQSFRNMYENSDLNLSEDDEGSSKKRSSDMTDKERKDMQDKQRADNLRTFAKKNKDSEEMNDKKRAARVAAMKAGAKKVADRKADLKKKGESDPANTSEDTHPCKGLSEDDPCWKNYKQVGMKKKNGKEVPNCVPESNQFNTYRNMIDMWTEEVIESLQEETIVYRVKGMQKPEQQKFVQSAKMMGLKIKMLTHPGNKETTVTMTGTKKKLRDFDSVARGKSSYGDPSSVQHFDEK
jgi:hypothetical protein|tara:strand:- start:433 stop:2271 length:1839 start_codon:yes stop_codon:yes gene_type:complete